MTAKDPNRLPHEKGFHISWDQIHRDSRALAWRLDGKGPDDGAWRAVVAITRGGMAPAMIVARELDIRTVDTISVVSYHSGGGKADQRREANPRSAASRWLMMPCIQPSRRYDIRSTCSANRRSRRAVGRVERVWSDFRVWVI